MFAPEKIPYAIERYQKEVERVFSVLESVLSKQEWIATGQVTVRFLPPFFLSLSGLVLILLLYPQKIDCRYRFLPLEQHCFRRFIPKRY